MLTISSTRHFLLDMAQSSPYSCRFVGLDISDSGFPATSALPSNVELLVHNFFDPFPNGLLGTFDVVHMRLMMLAMKHGDWIKVLRNILTSLKPGGWIQWTEVDILRTMVVKDDDAKSTDKVDAVMSAWKESIKRLNQKQDSSGALKLLEVFKQVRSESCDAVEVRTGGEPDIVHLNNENVLSIATKVIRSTLTSPRVEMEQELHALVGEARKQCEESGCTIKLLVMTYAGRRP